MSFRRQNQQAGSGGRKTSNGTIGPANMPSTTSGNNISRATPVRSRNTMKPPSQSAPVFEGVYNNARMLHFLTAVVGSTCDIRVKNGSVYEGIFKTLSSRCELAVDAVHRSEDSEGGGGGGGPTAMPKREEITDTMIFSPTDLVTMTCRDVDLNYAIRADTFTDTTIGSLRVNGEHREKVLQRWDGGDRNGESYDLETDASNGWDASEMFRFNEETYGVKSTYDSSLSSYTVPLERGSSEGFRQREARAARLASEIESSPQYRHRVALENEEGKSEEEKYSAVVREGSERGRDSPSFSSSGSREGKYIPLPQRVREMGVSVSGMRGERGGPPSSSSLPNRTGGPTSGRPGLPGSSPRQSLPASGGPATTSADRSSPLSVRRGYSPHHSQSSPPARPCDPAPGSPPSAAHPLPHSLSHPQALADAARSINGVASRTSPKSQRPVPSNRTLRTTSSHSTPAVSRSPKPDPPSQEPAPVYVDITSAPTASPGPTPLFPVDVNDILSSSAKDRTDSPASPQDGKNSKAPSVQQRSQIEELRKFGKEFRLLPSSSPSSAVLSEPSQFNPAPSDSASAAEAKPAHAPTPPPDPPVEIRGRELSGESVPAPGPPTATASTQASAPEMRPPSAKTPGSDDARQEAAERSEGVADQVKKSTLNPNAKEFNPNKGPMTLLKPSTAPTPPRPTPPSPSVVMQAPPGQGAIYNPAYLSYMSPIQIQGHSVQAPQMYQYTMSTVSQGKYPRPKGNVVSPRPDHHSSSAPPMLQAAASAAGPPLVASPYQPSYLQYSQVIQAMPHYPGQPVYSMLQGGRMLTQGGHPQALGPPGPQYPGQAEGPPGPQQSMYAPQTFSHHSGAMHPPQPSSTPTGSQPQHPAPSPGQAGQSGPQSMYHSGHHSAPTPPMAPGHSSPQGSYPIQGYSIPSHQPLPHGYSSLGQLTQAHVQGGMSGPHHSGGHGPPPVMLLHAPPPQQGPGPSPQHPQQQGVHQHYAYISHPQAVQVQAHPAQQLSFHPPGN